MAVTPIILLLALVTILVEGEMLKTYLPKDPGYLPMSDLYARGIARSGWDSFYKVNKQERAALISAAPVNPNAVTKVTMYLEKGNAMHFGCGPKLETKMIEMGDPCYMPHVVSYYPPQANKLKYKIRDNACEGTLR